eukprot:TRINITY_DN2023_c0_g3_i1.p1 TRINITY_DN2023_c0_g3~~TRINITY_DN2023_c0_g3_i1.p1  ORF type:complete len:237 (+),score=97.09 TRINITY_DN2023_c0_g3_i1:41-712(+)
MSVSPKACPWGSQGQSPSSSKPLSQILSAQKTTQTRSASKPIPGKSSSPSLVPQESPVKLSWASGAASVSPSSPKSLSQILQEQQERDKQTPAISTSLPKGWKAPQKETAPFSPAIKISVKGPRSLKPFASPAPAPVPSEFKDPKSSLMVIQEREMLEECKQQKRLATRSMQEIMEEERLRQEILAQYGDCDEATLSLIRQNLEEAFDITQDVAVEPTIIKAV